MPTAYFAFEQKDPNGIIRHFVFRLDDAVRIDEARAILANPSSLRHHVRGTVISRRAPYNPNWSFHLDPTTIGFFEFAIEVCDANVTYVEEHLDEVGGAFLPGGAWCPWSSKLVSEVSPTGS